MIRYEGLFFETAATSLIHLLEENPLPIKAAQILHCTFKYHPNEKEIFNDIVGKEFEIELIDYACNGENSDFEIVLPKQLENYYINYDPSTNSLIAPHITVFLPFNAISVNTTNLEFQSLSKPVKVIGNFGYCIEENNREIISFLPL